MQSSNPVLYSEECRFVRDKELAFTSVNNKEEKGGGGEIKEKNTKHTTTNSVYKKKYNIHENIMAD
jgi:hypothetical protein